MLAFAISLVPPSSGEPELPAREGVESGIAAQAPLGGDSLAGLRVLFLGKAGGGTRREVQRTIRLHGGQCAEAFDESVHLVVVGDDEASPPDASPLVTPEMRMAARLGRLEIISETMLWERVGLVDDQQHVRTLYTPAMLAQLLKVPVSTIRRWRRRGLLVPVREVRKLPYFDFQEVAVARRLVEMLAAGETFGAIERQLEDLARRHPEISRPLAELSVVVEGRRLLVRRGDSLLEPSGQRRLDFESSARRETADEPPTAPFVVAPHAAPESERREFLTAEEMLDEAACLEDEGNLEDAAALYRTVLASGGPRADVCFLLAEALYRMNDLSGARERYYAALEIDENFLEARANLGCVLSQLGQNELAVAAFEGALAVHADYADAHYHLARTLDDLDRSQEALQHWRRFLALAPDSPWADEAVERLQASDLRQ